MNDLSLEEWRRVADTLHKEVLRQEKDKNLNLSPDAPLTGRHREYDKSVNALREARIMIAIMESDIRMNERFDLLARHIDDESALSMALKIIDSHNKK